jgi:hydroxymethylglutaryl-CoA synthase
MHPLDPPIQPATIPRSSWLESERRLAGSKPSARCCNVYSGSCMIGMTAVLDIAKPGDRVLMISYGSGAGSDAFDLRVTDLIEQRRDKAPSTRSYIERRTEIDYALYSRYRGKLSLD